ncbi:MAG TPA: hypothetical protein VF950_16690 [Planctomycetota bacterium]
MKRSSPTVPDPLGGPPKRGCFYMCRYALLLLAVLWVAVWFAFPGKHPGRRLIMAAAWSVPLGIFFGVPLVNLADRLEIRRYCKSRGLKILKYKWRGVIYMDGDVKRYSRWPDDFVLTK